ncbi:MAG: dockerin type I repeat-containing protein [Planctomycetes bacterium]|nr:dockerin type I repeat-containing protein [Planctomycetota bacterium]
MLVGSHSSQRVRALVIGLVLCGVSGLSSLRAQGIGFELSDATGTVGDVVDVSMLLDNDSADIQGFAFGVCHDIEDVDLADVEDGVDLAALAPDFNDLVLEPGGWAVSMVVSFPGLTVIGPAMDWHAYTASYEILGASGSPTTEVAFCESIGAPPIALVIAVGSAPVLPDNVTNATITIGSGTGAPFRRGDVNDDGAVDISDVIFLLASLFTADSAPLECDDAGDVNDDGMIDIGDAVTTLGALFGAGAAIPAPGSIDCGPDPTSDTLDCATSSCP